MPREGEFLDTELSGGLCCCSARVDFSPCPHRWVGYRSSKAATNQVILTLQRELELKATPSIAVALHPGTVVGTNLSSKWTNPKDVGKKNGVFYAEESTAKLLDVIKGLNAEDGGRFLDWAGKDIKW